MIDKLEAIKKILEDYKLYVMNSDKGKSPRCNQDDAAEQILQLFQSDVPDDDALKGEIATVTRDFWEKRKTSLECAAQILNLVKPSSKKQERTNEIRKS